MSYKDIPYLILILLTNPFDLMKSHFAVELIVFELYGQMSVLFFLNHTLVKSYIEMGENPLGNEASQNKAKALSPIF